MHILIKFLSTQTSSLHVPQTYKQTMHHVAYISISLWWFSPFNQQLISLSLNFFSRSPFHNTNSSFKRRKTDIHTYRRIHIIFWFTHNSKSINSLTHTTQRATAAKMNKKKSNSTSSNSSVNDKKILFPIQQFSGQ